MGLPLTDRGNELVEMMPRFMRDAPTVQKVTDVFAREFERVEDAVDDIRANGFVETATWGLAEFERDLIVERTKAGLEAARARGRKGGHPRKVDKATLTMAMAAMINPKSVASEVAKRLGMTTTTLYMYVNGSGSPKEVGAQLLRGPS